MKTKIYKSKKGLVKAIRQIESTPPQDPLKGSGNSRVETLCAGVIAAIVKKRIEQCNHVTTVYARRSQSKLTKYGIDKDYISPEMDELIEANQDLFAELVRDYIGWLEWRKCL